MIKIIWILLGFFFLGSCAIEEEEGGPTVAEGIPVRLALRLDQKEMFTRSGLSTSQEQAVHSIFVLVFDKHGAKVSQMYASSNISAALNNIQTRSGNNMSIYVIANLSPQNTGLADASTTFNQVYSIADLNAVNLQSLAADLNLNLDLVMYGMLTNQTISSTSVQTFTVPLNFVVARITLYVVKSLTNASDSYALTDWTVQNYPAKSFLLPQATDANTPGSTTDFTTSVTSKAWVDTTIMIGTTPTPAKYAFLYMYENRRGGRVSGAPTDIDQRKKALYAPTSATAIALRGYYKSGTTVTGLTTTVYLGADNYADYNVRRGYDYSYVVTIKGIADYGVDTRVEKNTYGYQVNVFNTTMDNHADRRPLQIFSWPGTSSLTITNTDGVTPCSWLRLSSIDLNQAVGNARVTYNPSTDMVSSMLLTFPTTTPAVMASQMVYLYADENTAAGTNTGKRSALLTVVSNEGLGNSQTVTITISQYGYQTMGPSAGFRTVTTTGALNTGTNSDYTLIVENIEEAALNLTPGAAAGTEATTNMQWGFNQMIAQPAAGASVDYYYRNGYESTLGLVFSSGGGAPNSTLRAPYGRASAASSGTASVTITENAMNPIFNTYPARYCFEKNRDLDGDGQITNPNTQNVDEITWYLPAAEELYGMYVGQYGFTNSPTGANYQVSSEIYGSTTNTNSMSYSSGIGGQIGKSQAVSVRCVKRLYQTLAAGVKNSPYVESGTRIINNQGYASNIQRSAKVSRPTPVNSQNSTINNALPPRFEVAKTDAQLNGSSGGYTMTWAQASGWTTASDNSGSAGVVASPATGCNAYTETSGDLGTWRVPTQREMYIIFFMRKELGADSFTGLGAANYWTSSQIASNLGWYGVRGNSTLGFGGKTTIMNVRCIRDL